MDGPDINDELEQVGDDQLKRLDVLLKYLQRSAITKAQFIEKFAPAKEEQFEVQEEDNIAVPAEDDDF